MSEINGEKNPQASGPTNPSSDSSSDPWKFHWAGGFMADPWFPSGVVMKIKWGDAFKAEGPVLSV